MKDWDYALLTKSAKEAGGPEMFLKILKEDAKEDGVNQGRKEGVIATGALGLLAYLGYKVYRKFFGKKKTYPKEVVEKAEQELLQGMKDCDGRSEVAETYHDAETERRCN